MAGGDRTSDGGAGPRGGHPTRRCPDGRRRQGPGPVRVGAPAAVDPGCGGAVDRGPRCRVLAPGAGGHRQLAGLRGRLRGQRAAAGALPQDGLRSVRSDRGGRDRAVVPAAGGAGRQLRGAAAPGPPGPPRHGQPRCSSADRTAGPRGDRGRGRGGGRLAGGVPRRARDQPGFRHPRRRLLVGHRHPDHRRLRRHRSTHPHRTLGRGGHHAHRRGRPRRAGRLAGQLLPDRAGGSRRDGRRGAGRAHPDRARARGAATSLDRVASSEPDVLRSLVDEVRALRAQVQQLSARLASPDVVDGPDPPERT